MNSGGRLCCSNFAAGEFVLVQIVVLHQINIRNEISAVNIMTERCKQVILCVGECVLDIIQVCDEFPREDSDLR
jgi:hypothetical protein